MNLEIKKLVLAIREINGPTDEQIRKKEFIGMLALYIIGAAYV